MYGSGCPFIHYVDIPNQATMINKKPWQEGGVIELG
jgi:hypothetical protein